MQTNTRWSRIEVGASSRSLWTNRSLAQFLGRKSIVGWRTHLAFRIRGGFVRTGKIQILLSYLPSRGCYEWFWEDGQADVVAGSAFFHIENTMKESDVQPQFYAFNLAPADRKGASRIDFTNGCSNIEQYGIGLTPSGYYPCAIAGGIDRVANRNLGRTSIQQTMTICSIC